MNGCCAATSLPSAFREPTKCCCQTGLCPQPPEARFIAAAAHAARHDPLTGLRHQADYTARSPLRSAVGRDGRIAATAPRVDVSGGWWDAGDFGRYVPSAATTIMSLLYAYRFNPTAFADRTLVIPESGNGVPDLLDEIRWELTWLLKMQRNDGAVYHKAATRQYAPGMADRDPNPALLYDVSTQATAQFAGALAEASIVYRTIDPAFGARPLKRAIQHRIENPVSKLILQGKFAPKDVIPVNVRDGEFSFDRVVH